MRYENSVRQDLEEFSRLSDDRFFNLARRYGQELISKVNSSGYNGIRVLLSLGKLILNTDYTITDNDAGLIKIMGCFSDSIDDIQREMKNTYTDKFELSSILARCGLRRGPSGCAYGCAICMIVLDGRIDYAELDILEYLFEC